MANKNRIKVARSVTRDNLPGVLDYGELGFVNNTELIVGNYDGSDFIVNDYNNLINKPASAGPETTLTLTADESIQAFRAVRIKANGKAVRASKNSTTLGRVVGIATEAAALDEDFTVQTEGTINNSGWSFTPGGLVYLGNTVGDLTQDISGFADTDARTLIGVAISATEIALNIGSSIIPETGQTANLVQSVTDGDTDNAASADAIHDFVKSITDIIEGNVSTNAGNISTNTSNISTNAGNITTNADDIDNLETRMDDAETDITNNATDISTNAGDISDNAGNISTNATNIGINATNISNLTNTVNGQIVQAITDGDTTHAPSADAVFDYIATNFPLYSPTGKEAGKFYHGTDTPSNSNRLNYDGDLWVRDLHTNAASIYIGSNKLSSETGVLIYSDAANINDYEVVVTQLGVDGSKDRTGIKGDVAFLDGILILNAMQDGLDIVPSHNAEITVERGTENNVGVRWNENRDVWDATEDGTNYGRIPLLDINDKLPAEYLPDSIGSGLTYQGTWQAASGEWPADPEVGHYYIISLAGTIDTYDLAAGDWIVFNGNFWDKVDNTERVTSVAGKTGNVTLTPQDLGLDNIVVAPESSVDNAIVVSNGTSGDQIKNAPAKITDEGMVSVEGVEPGFEFKRAVGDAKSMKWNEDRNTIVFDAPIEAPNISNEVAIASNVRVENDYTFNTSIADFVTIENAQAVKLDIIISDRFAQNVRHETITATVGWNAFNWTATQTGPGLGNTDNIESYLTLDGMNLQLGFEVTGGSWNVVVIANGFPFWGGPGVTYTKGNV